MLAHTLSAPPQSAQVKMSILNRTGVTDSGRVDSNSLMGQGNERTH